jgi:hypothetical protein
MDKYSNEACRLTETGMPMKYFAEHLARGISMYYIPVDITGTCFRPWIHLITLVEPMICERSNMHWNRQLPEHAAKIERNSPIGLMNRK